MSTQLLMPEEVVTDYRRPGFRRLIGEAGSIARLIPKVASAQIKTLPILETNHGLVHPTFSMPGVGSPGCSLDDIVVNLRDAGINARTWGDHINLGPTHRAYKRMVRDIHAFHCETGKPVVGLGHSLGGLYQLYLARVFPEIFQQVICLASPCELELEDAYSKTNVGIAFTAMDLAKPLYERRLMEHWRAERELDAHTVPRTMLIAARDGVVDPLSCELPDQPGCKNYYLDTTHADILGDEVAAELVAFVIHNGNEARLPLSISRHLVSREDVEVFRKKDADLRETVSGIGNFVARTTATTSRRAAESIYAGVNAPFSLLARRTPGRDANVVPLTPAGGVSLGRTPIVAAPIR